VDAVALRIAEHVRFAVALVDRHAIIVHVAQFERASNGERDCMRVWLVHDQRVASTVRDGEFDDDAEHERHAFRVVDRDSNRWRDDDFCVE
jgi:hypothetical protein